MVVVFVGVPVGYETLDKPAERLYSAGEVKYVSRSLHDDGSIYAYIIHTEDPDDMTIAIRDEVRDRPGWKGEEVFIHDSALSGTFVCTDDMDCREISNVSTGTSIRF